MVTKKITGLFCIAALVLLVSCATKKGVRYDSAPWQFEQTTNAPVWPSQ